MVLVAAALVACAVCLALPSARDLRAQRLVGPPSAGGGIRGRRTVSGLVRRSRLGPSARRRESRHRVSAIQAVAALAAELVAGQPPLAAVVRASGDPPVWPRARAAARRGGDVAAALQLDAAQHPMLAQVAACWRAGSDSGAGLAAAVSRVAEAARAAEDVRVDLEGQLAGPRASARMLAVLPLVGIGFGLMLGGDPVAWLLTSTPGRLCLLAGVLLTVAGVWWTGRIAASVERLL